MADPRGEFTSTFRPVTVECERPMHVRSVIWMRTEGGAIGIQRSEDRIQIPGYLFSDNKESRARLDPEGRMGVIVLPLKPAQFYGLLVPPGRWAVRLEGTGGAVTTSVLRTDSGDSFAFDETGSRFSTTGIEPTDLTISLWTLDASGAHVRGVVLERVLE
jgi:hypothetical protein